MDMGKSWLQSDQVEMKNPSWQAGMEKLMKIIARGTGYMDISLHCVLNKLVVYGKGGHVLKRQDTE
ncbi:hypothetical protein PI124_g9561 [Phytophthora idaei]|nr:hypothetical protein PI125_g9164 [Phytophthora idaei]KAG3157224.1 hypothetical protein PI126_g8435 [Phytophthora idaei]KAG3245723.1 hypothetical protein PI124_g9561 [Phytophthora idaei]